MVTRERLALENDFVPSLGIRAVKGRHQQVEVGRERLHDGHLGRVGPDDGGHHLGGMGVGVEPSRQRGVVERLEVTLDALGPPRVQVLPDTHRRPLRLQAQRVPAEIRTGHAVVVRLGRGGSCDAHTQRERGQPSARVTNMPMPLSAGDPSPRGRTGWGKGEGEGEEEETNRFGQGSGAGCRPG